MARVYRKCPDNYLGTTLRCKMSDQFELLTWLDWDAKIQVKCMSCGGKFWISPKVILHRPVCQVCLNGQIKPGSDVWRLRQMRSDLGLTNAQIGRITGYVPEYVSRAMMGRIRPPAGMIDLCKKYEDQEKETANDQ